MQEIRRQDDPDKGDVGMKRSSNHLCTHAVMKSRMNRKPARSCIHLQDIARVIKMIC